MKKCVGFVLIGLLLAGCGIKEKPADVGKVFSQADTFINSGDTNAAINVLNEALNDPAYSRDRSRLFNSLINTLLIANRISDAQNRYLTAVEEDKDLAMAGFGMVYNYYRRKNDTDSLVEWTKTLVEAPLPKVLAEQAFAWHMQAYRAKGQFDRIIDLVPVCVKKFDGNTSRKILNDLIQSILAAKDYNDATRLMDAIEKVSRKASTLQVLVDVSRTDLLIKQEQWNDAEQHFMRTAPDLPDGDLGSSISRVASIASQREKLDLVDRLCSFVLKNQKEKNGARCEAARQWVEVAKKRNDTGGIPNRLNSLMKLGIPSDVLLHLYEKQFYFVMNDGKRQELADMVSFGDELILTLKDKDDKTQVKALALDGTFILEDYARSLEILEEGLPERGEDWHQMAINKVEAHLALNEGKKKEAIERFRKYMDYVSTWENPEKDPSTGIMHTKEMCLGRNAKRIGDIFASMGDKKASREAYEEAKKYYKIALSEVRPDSNEEQVVQAEMAKIP